MNWKKLGCLVLVFAMIFVSFSGTLDVVHADEKVNENTEDITTPIDLIDESATGVPTGSIEDNLVPVDVIDGPVSAEIAETPSVQLDKGKATSNSTAIWQDIETIEKTAINKKGGNSAIPNLTTKFFEDLYGQIEQVVCKWSGYASGTFGKGDSNLAWTDKWGIIHIYRPSTRLAKYQLSVASLQEQKEAEGCVLRYNYVTKKTTELQSPNGTVHVDYDYLTFRANDVVIFSPYSHIDCGFSTEDQEYRTSFAMGKEIAEAIQGKCYIFTQEYVTPERIAKALESCRVVIYDGHGATKRIQYPIPANPITVNSYITLFTMDSSDISKYVDSDDSNEQMHLQVMYDGDRTVYAIDGAVIASEMTSFANNNFFWIAACNSMETNGLFKELQGPFKKGVEVVFGYTRTVNEQYNWPATFYFWDKMINGTENGEATVKDAAANMWYYIGEGPCNSTEAITEHSYPRFVSSSIFDQYPVTDTYNPNSSDLHKWHCPESDWKLRDFDNPGYEPDPEPNPDPNSNLEAYLMLDPMGLTYFPQKSGFPRSYYRMYRDTYGHGDIHRKWASNQYGIGGRFLRFDWEVNQWMVPKAYAVFACSDGFSDEYTEVHGKNSGYGSRYVWNDTPGELDEIHKTCVRIEAEITHDENGRVYAQLPYNKSPDNHTWAEYFASPILVDMDRCDYIFDHWEFSNNNGTPDKNKVKAKAIYYNRFDINGLFEPVSPVVATISEENGKLLATATGPDQVTRTTVIPWVDESQPNDNYFGADAGCECHYWIYDGVDHWETDEYDPTSSEGAWAVVKYHCAHGCKYDKKHPLTFRVPASITSNNADTWGRSATTESYTFTAFVGQNKYSDNSIEMRGGLDGWTRYPSTVINKEPNLTDLIWVFKGFEWNTDQKINSDTNKNITAVAHFSLQNAYGSLVETRDIPATIIAIENEPLHTYRACVSKDIAPNNREYMSDPICYENLHHWVFDGFEYTGGDSNVGDIFANYHCDLCDKTFGYWLWEIPWYSGFLKVCGFDAPLVSMFVSSDHSLDNEAKQEERVFGHSSEEWKFKGFEWENNGGVRAYAVYYYDMSRETEESQIYSAYLPPSEWYEYIDTEEGHFVKYRIEVKPEPVKSSRPGIAAIALPKYKAFISADQAPDGLPNEETTTIIPGIDPGVKPQPFDGSIIGPPEEYTIDWDNYNFRPIVLP